MGLGAQVLSRLDQMYFEASITPDDDGLRRELFEKLTAQDQAGVENLLEGLGHVRALPSEQGHPVVASAKRVLEAGSTSMAARALGPEEWGLRVRRLGAHIQTGDHDELAEELAAIRRRVHRA